MRASEIPTASHRCSSRRRCGPSALPALLTSVAMLTPLLCRIRWAERTLDPTRRMPPEFGHWCPRVPGAALPHAGATPPAHPPEPYSKPASRPPGLSVIPPFPARYAQYLTFRPHIPRGPAARVKGRLEREVDRTPKFALDPELRLRSPWRVHGTGASARPYEDRNARSGSGLALEFELGLQGVRSCACSSGPRRGGLRSRNSPTIEVDQLERSTEPACAVPQNTAIWDSGAINAARQPEPVFGVLGANDVNLRR
jgi:hypothetical protein